MNQNGNDYVSLVRIPRKWFYVFVWTFSILVIANVLIEFFTGWAWQHLGQLPKPKDLGLLGDR